MQVNLAALERIRAENSTHHLRAPRADQAREAQDLTPVKLEGDILEGLPAKVLRFQYDLGIIRAAWLEPHGVAGNITSDHHVDEVLVGCLGHLLGGDAHAVAEDRHTVADREQLIELVADE